MQVIAVICQKGGTSKTTTAINLAVEAVNQGLEVVVIDLDPQVSAFDWKDIRGDKPPVVAAIPVPLLERTLKAAAENGVDLAIIDTAGRTNEAASAAAAAADLILVPLQPSLIDLKTLEATRQIIRLAGDKPTRAILARVRAGGPRQEAAAGWLQERGIEVCPVSLGERVTYQDAYAGGLGVTEAEPSGKAAQEIRELYKYVFQLSNFLKMRKPNGETKRTRKRVA